MKERKEIKKTNLSLSLHQSIASAPCTPSCKTSGGSLRIAQWSKGMKMTCCLHCFGMEFWSARGGGFQIFGLSGVGNISKSVMVSCTIKFFSLCLSLRLVFYMLNGLGLIICQAKQLYHNFWPCRNSKVLFLWKNGYKFTRPHFPIAFSLAGFY